MKKNTNTGGFSVLGDNPADIFSDQLGFNTFVEPFADRLIKSMNHTPFTVGIMAEWGQGKTSMMKMLRKHLADRECITIWFDPWKYNSRDDVWKGLAYTLVREIKKNRNLVSEITQKQLQFKSFIARFFYSKVLGDTWGQKLLDTIEKEPWSPKCLHDFESNLESLFTHVYSNQYAKNKKPMILFVDDLDRCLPEPALAVMEALKLVLNRTGLITVMGIAERELGRAVCAAYSRGLSGDILETDPDWGKRYIRKIIQIPFPVPSISMGSFDKYIGNCIKDSGIASHLGENESWNGIIRETCQSNLREVKRLINHFISEMDKSWANAQASDLTLQESLDGPRVAFILLLSWRFKQFYQYVRSHPHDRELMIRYQIFFLSDQNSEDIRHGFLDRDNEFLENKELQDFFRQCFSAHGKKSGSLVNRFRNWEDFFPYLQFGIQPELNIEKQESPPAGNQSIYGDLPKKESPEGKMNADSKVTHYLDELLSSSQRLISSGYLIEAEKRLHKGLERVQNWQEDRYLPSILGQLATVYQLNGKFDKAVAELNKALS